MVTIDEAQDMLNDIAEALPPEFYVGLNGGILLLPDEKMSPYAKNDDLFILGEYVRSNIMGRSIYIYYGSFARMFAHMDKEAFREKLEHTLVHEFTHHIESMAGESGLEKWDAARINDYLEKHR